MTRVVYEISCIQVTEVCYFNGLYQFITNKYISFVRSHIFHSQINQQQNEKDILEVDRHNFITPKIRNKLMK